MPGQRGLEVVADAAQEVVLGGVELEQLGVLRLDLAEQLGVADGDRDLAGEQLEQVLVGALPGPGRRQAADEHAERVAARRGGPRGPAAPRRGRPPRSGSRPGRTRITVGIDHAEGRPGVGAAVLARNSTPSRGEAPSIAARIRPSSRLRRSRSAARRLWLSARRASSSSPATRIGVDRSPAETRSTAAAMARSGRVRSAASRYDDDDGEEHRDRETEQQHPREVGVGRRIPERPLDEQDQEPEGGERQDRGQDEREGQAGPEAEAGLGGSSWPAPRSSWPAPRSSVSRSTCRREPGWPRCQPRSAAEASSAVAATSR